MAYSSTDKKNNKADTSLKTLERLKKHVKNWVEYWQPNIKTYDEFSTMVCDTAITSQDKAVLQKTGKPEIEFNILAAPIARLRGEWAKNEPSVQVTPSDGVKVDSKMLENVEDHLRHIIYEANTQGCEYEVLSDLLIGGFSGLKLWTEYAASMGPNAFNQVMRVGRVYNPKLVGYDILAREKTKSDGRFAFEWYPKTREEFEDEWPDKEVSSLSFTRTDDLFNWSYKNNDEEMIIICCFYEKRKEYKTIVNVIDYGTMTQKEYKDFAIDWEASRRIEPVPALIGKPRKTSVDVIYRYLFIENQILECIETDFTSLPYIFVDGDSRELTDTTGGNNYQRTKPYVYHAKGAQRLKNFAGQCLANELENMVQSKYMFAHESLPQEDGFIEAITNPQQASVYVWQARNKNDPSIENPPPQALQRTPIPPEVTGAFMAMSQTIQETLGDFQNEINRSGADYPSGKAIIESASLNNAAAEPYLVGFMQAWGVMLNEIVKLLPKYYVTPRTIPLRSKDGKTTYKEINKNGKLDFNYDDNALQVKVEPGVNFQIQKSRALQQIATMGQSFPIFAKFMNEDGLEILLDNMEIRGIDQLKELSGPFMQKIKQMEQQAQQQQNPEMIKAQLAAQTLQLKNKELESNLRLKTAQMSLDERKMDVETFKIMSDAKMDEADNMARMAKADADISRAKIEQASELVKMDHKHNKEALELHHQVKMDHHAASMAEKSHEIKAVKPKLTLKRKKVEKKT